MEKTAPPPNIEALLAKAKQPSADAMRLHPYYRGKVEIALKCRVRDFNDFAIWYTPGVAASCRAIAENPEQVYEHTHKWNTVAVVSDGTRVLGLGDIGPKAGLPVMEGKALLFKYLGGIDAWPIMLDTKDPDKIIETVKLIQPGSAASTWKTFRSRSASAFSTPCAGIRKSPSGTTISRAPPR